MLTNSNELKKCWLLAVVVLAISFTTINAQPPNTPESRVKWFYSWYFKSINDGKEPSKDVINSNLSKRFSRSYFSQGGHQPKSDSFDYDVFLNSQEWSEDWVDNMNVGKATIKGNTAVVKLKLSMTDDDFVLTLKVSLVKEAGVWKIDRVTSQGGRGTR